MMFPLWEWGGHPKYETDIMVLWVQHICLGEGWQHTEIFTSQLIWAQTFLVSGSSSLSRLGLVIVKKNRRYILTKDRRPPTVSKFIAHFLFFVTGYCISCLGFLAPYTSSNPLMRHLTAVSGPTTCFSHYILSTSRTSRLGFNSTNVCTFSYKHWPWYSLGSPLVERNPSLLVRDEERMKMCGKALGYHGEWTPWEVPRPKNLGVCGSSGFCLETYLRTPFTMIPPQLYHTLHCPNLTRTDAADKSMKQIPVLLLVEVEVAVGEADAETVGEADSEKE